jgi:hypothetical protein
MGSQPDYIRKKFAPIQATTPQNALAHRIRSEFPRIGGPRISRACADMILEVFWDHVRPSDHVTHGQILWMAISVDDPPRRHQRIAETDLVPVVLNLSTPEDIDRRLQRKSTDQRLLEKALRLCREAHRQGV